MPSSTSGVVTSASVTKLGPEHAGQVLVAGSHGGAYSGYLAARAGVRAVILNDAGGGLDGAGFASLLLLDGIGMAAATVAHHSARVGDGADMLARGIISHVNATAARLGCAVGNTAQKAAEEMTAAPLPSGVLAEQFEEARILLSAERDRPQVWALDSVSLVRPEDVGQIVVTGSHGGLLGGDPASAVRCEVLACAFNDAGVGADRAGISRLPALDLRGIAAVTVNCMSARIGDARSTWATGMVSHVNDTAARLGGAPEQSVQDFTAAVRANFKERERTA